MTHQKWSWPKLLQPLHELRCCLDWCRAQNGLAMLIATREATDMIIPIDLPDKKHLFCQQGYCTPEGCQRTLESLHWEQEICASTYGEKAAAGDLLRSSFSWRTLTRSQVTAGATGRVAPSWTCTGLGDGNKELQLSGARTNQ